MNDDTKTRRRNALRDSMLLTPYARSLGLEFELFEENGVRLRLPFAPGFTNDGSRLHGGVVSAALDTTAAAAFWASYDFSAVVSASTVAMSIQFTKACNESDLWCSARVVRATRRLAFIEASSLDVHGELIAHGNMTFMISPRSSSTKQMNDGEGEDLRRMKGD